MSSEEIENNPSFKELNDKLQGASFIGKAVKILEKAGIKNQKISEAFQGLEDFKKEAELLSKTPDKFNRLFSKKGWIAHESINSDLMREAVALGDQGEIDKAEELLVNYYTSEKLIYLIHPLKRIDAFRIRYDFFLKAIDDTHNERYYSAVPLILMMMDGAVNDISKSKGFFAEGTDLEAWDSIAAHSSGLTVLKELLNKGRNCTNQETIDQPYRNGILHGRDLGYATKLVTAKCWAAVIAIADWAQALKDGKGEPAEPEPEQTIKESLKDIASTFREYGEHKKRMDIVHKKLDSWSPRNLKIGIDIEANVSPDSYGRYTPEYEAARFAELWKKNNYGEIAKQIHHISKTNFKEDVRLVRQTFEGRRLLEFKLTEIKDCAAAVTEVFMDVTFEYDGQPFTKNIKLRFIFQDSNGDTLIIGDEKGKWEYLDFFFHEIEFAHFQE